MYFAQQWLWYELFDNGGANYANWLIRVPSHHSLANGSISTDSSLKALLCTVSLLHCLKFLSLLLNQLFNS